MLGSITSGGSSMIARTHTRGSLSAGLARPEPRVLLSTFAVHTTADESDGNFGRGDLSLREAIERSNASVGVVDRIEFRIKGAGVRTIAPTSALPFITDPVIIDGYTQPGARENTDP